MEAQKVFHNGKRYLIIVLLHQTKERHMIKITFQPELRPVLRNVIGPKDYREFRGILLESSRILHEAGLEDAFVSRYLSTHAKGIVSQRVLESHAKTVVKALRHSILLSLTGLSCRELATRLADSDLFRWFVGVDKVDGSRTYSKSTLDRFAKMFDDSEIEELIHSLNKAVIDGDSSGLILLRDNPLVFEDYFADSTCVKSNIHFPIDWLLLRDICGTLLKAIQLIRSAGLLNRMESSPECFAKRVNKLCIEMTHTRRRADSKSARKQILRRMKKLSKTVERHAMKHRDKLIARRCETEFSEAQAKLIIDRIDNVLEQLPAALRQAHERIIGERKVPNKDKILSAYEKDVHVIVRGKASGEIEFGNGLTLVEQTDGLIADWQFFKDAPPADSSFVKESVQRITHQYHAPKSYVGDRGFDSKSNKDYLEEAEIFNAICPRSVDEMRERNENDDLFTRLQTRRSATEARIAVFKNNYLGKPLRSKGFANRKTRVVLCILAHNLWKISSMAYERRKELEAERENAKAA